MIYMAQYKPEFSPKDREREHWLGRRLLEFGLEKEYGRTWPVAVGDHGRPFLQGCPEICFSISHTRGLAACAIHTCLVGLDVQEIVKPSPALVRRVLSLQEQELMEQAALEGEKQAAELFTRLWTLKESYVKAIGVGLGFPVETLSFRPVGPGEFQGNTPGFQYCQRRVFGRFILTLCQKDFTNP